MKIAEVRLKSVSPYGQSKHVTAQSLNKESAEDKERRTWRERIHSDKEGYVVIPPMAFKNSLAESAKYLSLRIPGKGKSTYTKHFESGILVLEGLQLPILKKDVPGTELFLPSDGKRGGGSRVLKIMPTIAEWEGTVVYHVLDETITPDIFRHVLEESGKFIGIGFFRPSRNGIWGRFEVIDIKWK